MTGQATAGAGPDDRLAARDARPAGAPAPEGDGFPVRGVIEGFYGPPWLWAERQRLVSFLAAHGFTAYAYAPKNDPLHRDRWREPYLPEEWERFAELARQCTETGITFVFGISPLGLRFQRRGARVVCDPDDLAALVAKIAAADAVGVRTFCLLVDDMPVRAADDGAGRDELGPASADVALVREVHRALAALGPDRRLWFVPQPYCGDTATPYLRQLGDEVPDDVEICWTGRDVCSADITLGHAREVQTVLRRPPLIWDNHPVNDGGMQHDPHLGPLRGRDARLPEATAGIVANLALQPEASRIALATVADYARAPASYDPERSWEAALVEVAGNPADAAAVAALAGLARRTPLEPGRRDTSLTPAIADFWRRWDDGDRHAAVDDMDARLTDLAVHAGRLTGMLANAALMRDLRPWSRKLSTLVAAVRLALDVLHSADVADVADVAGVAGVARRGLRPSGGAGTADRRRAVVDGLASARTTPHWVGGDELDAFARALLRAAGEVPRKT